MTSTNPTTNETRSPWADGDAVDAKLKAAVSEASEDEDHDDEGAEDTLSPFERMLCDMAGMQTKPSIAMSEQVKVLEDLADRFLCKGPYSKWQFVEGHLITPIDHAPFKGAGEPYVLLEILASPIDTKAASYKFDDLGGTRLGQVMDIRVARFVGNDIATFLAESAWFRPWTMPEAVAVPANEQAKAA